MNPSRREQNKLATRQALADAAYEIAVAHGLAAVTAAAVAEAAGVSRRTFFNYFSSTEAALSESVVSYVDAVADEIGERPADETLAEAAARAFQRAATPARLLRLAHLVHLVEATEGADVALFTLLGAHERLESILRERLRGHADDIYVETVAGVLVTVARVGLAVWSRRRRDELTAHGSFRPEALEDLRRCMLASLGTVARGLEPPGAAPPTAD